MEGEFTGIDGQSGRVAHVWFVTDGAPAAIPLQASVSVLTEALGACAAQSQQEKGHARLVEGAVGTQRQASGVSLDWHSARREALSQACAVETLRAVRTPESCVPFDVSGKAG